MSTAYAERIERLAAEAREAREGRESYEQRENREEREAADPAAAPTAEECGLVAARDGLGPVVGLYVEARTSAEPVRFSERELRLLHRATADWLAVYTRCYGVETDPSVTVREAAEVLVDTHDVTDVAALLTGVPER